MSIIAELKRRNVFKVGIAYLVVAWLLLQVVGVVSPILELPLWIPRAFLLLLTIGFPIAILLAWAFELTPDGIKSTATVNNEESIRPATGQKLNRLIIVTLGLVLMFVVVDSYVLDGDSVESQKIVMDESETSEFIVADLPEVEEVSIAVLPFVNLSDDQSQEYFSDGLTEELINKLAQLPEMLVAGRTSSFYFKGRNEDILTIAEALGVNYILEGSVRKLGDEVRISAQLVQADNGFNLWSETFESQFENIFDLENEITQSVATALSVRLGLGEFNRPGMTTNVAAYDAYLQGSAELQSNGIDAAYEALAQLNKAVTLDPNFGLAWMRLVETYEYSVIILPSEETADFPVLANQAREKARAAAPDMPELALDEASNLHNEGRWIEAENRLLGLLSEDAASRWAEPNLAYALLLRWAGLPEQSLPYFVRARRLDPQNTSIATEMSTALLALKRIDEANDEADRGLALNGATSNIFLGAVKMMAAYDLNDYVLALELVEAGGAPPSEEFVDVIRLLAENEPAAARGIINNILQNDQAMMMHAALVIPLVLVDEPQQAFDVFFEMTQRSGLDASSMGALPVWAWSTTAFRQLPDFKQHIIDIGLADFWLTTNQWGPFCQPLADDESDFECF